MLIREMTEEECQRVLAGSRLARLGCAHENQPYVVPVYLAFHQLASGDACLYGFTTPGQKIAWMRANPLVCVEVDEVTAYDTWASVIATGRYEELHEPSVTDGEMGGDDRLPAWRILKTLPAWWQPGSAVWAARADRDAPEPLVPIYYRIRIGCLTGHEATPDTMPIPDAMPTSGFGRWRWLRRTLARVRQAIGRAPSPAATNADQPR